MVKVQLLAKRLGGKVRSFLLDSTPVCAGERCTFAAVMTLGGTAAFHTLGCKLNFSETSTLARMLDEAGYARVSVDDRPDVVVINTCSVTDHADAKCRNAVRRARASNPDAFVAVVGCCEV